MAKTQTRACRRCRTRYDVLVAHDGVYPLSGVKRGCPRCGGRSYEEVFAVSRFAVQHEELAVPLYGMARAPMCGENQLAQHHFPYYDHGLGTVLHSPEHRQWCMEHDPNTGEKRDSPLVCVGDTDWDPIAIVDEQRAVSAEVDRKFAAYKAEMMADPDTARVWEMVDYMNEKRDYSMWGVQVPEAAVNLPPEGERLKQDLDGYLYTDSGWSTKEPQRPVPTALYAAGHNPNGLPDFGPRAFLTGDVIDASEVA